MTLLKRALNAAMIILFVWRYPGTDCCCYPRGPGNFRIQTAYILLYTNGTLIDLNSTYRLGINSLDRSFHTQVISKLMTSRRSEDIESLQMLNAPVSGVFPVQAEITLKCPGFVNAVTAGLRPVFRSIRVPTIVFVWDESSRYDLATKA
jgi:hypothetical protein